MANQKHHAPLSQHERIERLTQSREHWRRRARAAEKRLDREQTRIEGPTLTEIMLGDRGREALAKARQDGIAKMNAPNPYTSNMCQTESRRYRYNADGTRDEISGAGDGETGGNIAQLKGTQRIELRGSFHVDGDAIKWGAPSPTESPRDLSEDIRSLSNELAETRGQLALWQFLSYSSSALALLASCAWIYERFFGGAA